jgi:hypothetical protein
MSIPHRRLTRTLAGALAVSALAAPAAEARHGQEVHSDKPGNGSAEFSAPAPTVTRTIDAGFDVGSAAIGAGGAAAVLLLTAGAGSAVSHRHSRISVVR